MELDESCCLKGVGHGTDSAKCIALDKSEEVTIGRSVDVSVVVPSTMISRKHCILKKEPNQSWSVTDNNSLNGVIVNGEQLKPMIPRLLVDGDKVQLGVRDSIDLEAPFVWVYHNKRVRKKQTEDKSDIQLSQSSVKSGTIPKRKRENISSGSASPNKKIKDSPRNNSKKLGVVPGGWSPSAQLKVKIAEKESLMQIQIAAQEEKLAEMQALLLQKDKAQEQLQKELIEKENLMKLELKRQQEEMEEKKKQYKEDLKRTVEKQLQEREDCLQKKLESEKQKLIEEKQKVEESLKCEMQTRLGQTDKEFREKLENEMERLEKVIQKKECEQKLLTTELETSKAEQAKQKADVWKMKEDILSNFTVLMETELQCSICNELFVHATSLNCAHSFCASCIEQWVAVKKECPVCRAAITSQMRSILLDSYIDKMVEQLSDELKERRKTLVEERKADQLRREEEKRQAGAGVRGRGRRGRGRRGRARGGARGGGRRGQRGATGDTEELVIEITSEGEGAGNNSGVPTIVADVGANEEVVELSDQESDFDNTDLESQSSDMDDFRVLSESSSDESVEGVPGTYYGGYGTCYRCGNRGHWANGCPFYD